MMSSREGQFVKLQVSSHDEAVVQCRTAVVDDGPFSVVTVPSPNERNNKQGSPTTKAAGPKYTILLMDEVKNHY